ncbi:MAG: LytR C-terminal domain-containing protein [Patescibacteria group bacterium]
MAETEEKIKSKKSGKLGKIFLILVIIILVGIAAASSFMFYQAQQKVVELSTIKGQQMLAQKEVDTLLTEVKKHMVLPEKEKPTIATVTDVNALKKNQPFFENAQNGDKVIVYVQARKAIIYSPNKDIIVNVGSVAVDGNQQVAGATTENPITVEVRNGTPTSGLGQKVATALKEAGATIQRVADAGNKDYKTTIVVDTENSDDKDLVNAVAQSLNAQIVQSPEGETSSDADIIVIVGADKQ